MFDAYVEEVTMMTSYNPCGELETRERESSWFMCQSRLGERRLHGRLRRLTCQMSALMFICFASRRKDLNVVDLSLVSANTTK